MNIFTNIPFLRILLPFLSGILFALAMGAPYIRLHFLLMALALPVLFFFLKPKNILLKTAFLVSADLFLILLGASLTGAGKMSAAAGFYASVANVNAPQDYIAVISDIPRQKPKSTKCRLKLLAVLSGERAEPVKGSVYAYFKRSPGDSILQGAQALLLRARLTEIPPPENPEQFDYRSYLRNRQIYHVAFVEPGAFVPIPLPEDALNPAWAAGLTCKAFVLRQLRSSGLSATAYGICSALLTGYDADIEESVMDAFSHSGTLHVLSVSGLHTGLIYMVLAFLFDQVDRKKRYKLLKFLFITVFLWCFALLAGFAAPVLRAVIMFNLLGFGRIYFRSGQRHQINVLAVSAFILLFSDPYLVADIGFQLSYLAMAGLFCFQPPLAALWQPSHSLLRYCWQSITASFAATLSTLPVTLFIFKQFPLWFFICNLVVVPATFLLLLLALSVVAGLTFMAPLINFLVKWLVSFITLFNSERYGYFDQIHFGAGDALALSLLILLFSAALHFRSYTTLRASLILLVAWQAVALMESFGIKDRRLFSVYQVKKQNALSLKNRTVTLLNGGSGKGFEYYIRPHLISFCYPELRETDFNFFRFGGRSVLLLDSAGTWPLGDLGNVEVLVLAHNFRLRDRHVHLLPALKQVVSDGSNNNYSAGNTADLCRKFGIDFYDTRVRGAYLLALR